MDFNFWSSNLGKKYFVTELSPILALAAESFQLVVSVIASIQLIVTMTDWHTCGQYWEKFILDLRSWPWKIGLSFSLVAYAFHTLSCILCGTLTSEYSYTYVHDYWPFNVFLWYCQIHSDRKEFDRMPVVDMGKERYLDELCYSE